MPASVSGPQDGLLMPSETGRGLCAAGGAWRKEAKARAWVKGHIIVAAGWIVLGGSSSNVGVGSCERVVCARNGAFVGKRGFPVCRAQVNRKAGCRLAICSLRVRRDEVIDTPPSWPGHDCDTPDGSQIA